MMAWKRENMGLWCSLTSHECELTRRHGEMWTANVWFWGTSSYLHLSSPYFLWIRHLSGCPGRQQHLRCLAPCWTTSRCRSVSCVSAPRSQNSAAGRGEVGEGGVSYPKKGSIDVNCVYDMMCLHIKVAADLSIDEYTVYVYKCT